MNFAWFAHYGHLPSVRLVGNTGKVWQTFCRCTYFRERDT